MATLKFDNINKIYDNNVQAVFDFNLEVKDKEFIVFVGPSGCGKSTTLRMVAGLEDITYGDLYIDGKRVNEVLPKDRDISMVFQNYALFPHMTVYGNIAFALKSRKTFRPVYVKNEEIDKLEAECAKLRRKLRSLGRKIANNPSDEAVKAERKEAKAELNRLVGNIANLRVPAKGINTAKLNYETKLLNRAKSEAGTYAKKVAELEKLKEQYQPIEGDTDMEQYGKDLNTDYETYKNLLERKQDEVRNLQAEVTYLSENETELTEYRHMNRAEIDVEVNKVAEILELDEYLDRKPSALSGGQRQRVALGRAIVRSPKVFLMDEPLSNLDAKLRVQMRSEIIRIHEQVGATTIYVTHDQTEAMTMADRIVIMKSGYIQQIGGPEEVYNDPANTFVAGFIGSPAMNFLTGTIVSGKFVIKGETGYTVGLTDGQLELLKDYADGKELILGVRPEHAHTYDLPDVTLTNKLTLDCYLSELLGNDIIAYAELDGQKFSAKTNDQHQIKTHDRFEVGFDVNKMYFFDKETGLRIK